MRLTVRLLNLHPDRITNAAMRTHHKNTRPFFISKIAVRSCVQWIVTGSLIIVCIACAHCTLTHNARLCHENVIWNYQLHSWMPGDDTFSDFHWAATNFHVKRNGDRRCGVRYTTAFSWNRLRYFSVGEQFKNNQMLAQHTHTPPARYTHTHTHRQRGTIPSTSFVSILLSNSDRISYPDSCVGCCLYWIDVLVRVGYKCQVRCVACVGSNRLSNHEFNPFEHMIDVNGICRDEMNETKLSSGIPYSNIRIISKTKSIKLNSSRSLRFECHASASI